MLRTYLSVVLLLCLAVSFAPLSLIHSHDDHNHAEVAHHAISSTSIDDHDEVVANDIHHESSEEECKICEIQQSLNNQAYTINKQASVLNDAPQVVDCLGLESSVDTYLIESTSGRAPPRA
jgi:hypothetical protein